MGGVPDEGVLVRGIVDADQDGLGVSHVDSCRGEGGSSTTSRTAGGAGPFGCNGSCAPLGDDRLQRAEHGVLVEARNAHETGLRVPADQGAAAAVTDQTVILDREAPLSACQCLPERHSGQVPRNSGLISSALRLRASRRRGTVARRHGERGEHVGGIASVVADAGARTPAADRAFRAD
jgi:hypothetical protein